MDDFAHGRNVTALPSGLSQFTFGTKMQDLLPDVWKLEDDFASQKANLRDLLSHVSGLTRYAVIVGAWTDRCGLTLSLASGTNSCTRARIPR